MLPPHLPALPDSGKRHHMPLLSVSDWRDLVHLSKLISNATSSLKHSVMLATSQGCQRSPGDPSLHLVRPSRMSQFSSCEFPRGTGPEIGAVIFLSHSIASTRLMWSELYWMEWRWSTQPKVTNTSQNATGFYDRTPRWNRIWGGVGIDIFQMGKTGKGFVVSCKPFLISPPPWRPPGWYSHLSIVILC